MRDLFRFLIRYRDTLLFLALMALSFSLLVKGNAHHRAWAIGTSGDLVGTLNSWRSEITEYARLKEQNRRLQDENTDLRNRHRSSYSPVDARFVRINDSIHEQRYRFLAARLIRSTSHKQRNVLLLDKGTREGVAADMGVITAEGIVGVVQEASPHFAAVKSILNPDIRTSVRLRRTGHFGLLVWDTGDPRTASVADIAKHVPVQPGDTVETRGADGTFPTGVPVGVVTEVGSPPGDNYLQVRVRLTEDLTRAGPVQIVFDLMRLERDSLGQDLLEE
ncbi:MAG TPA: rod shape-determining protein MreC [Flavobacteriales bacterium]|nr:rod shape-determining protein MreC [Flavobacteriales bacterium]HOP42530.1 rod shape-determining protein MreC [Flavobacteriales bacterium]HPJ51866.1 rod shape-determining protein MreC [Flavobacteriales bacterium]HPQ57817.1 rod shape-determining protein MreC [Flavobacteriales bacterium]